MPRPRLLDPNEYYPHYRTKRVAKTAAERKPRKGGKIMLTVSMTPNEYNQLRDEAIRRKVTMVSVVRECLLAGMCPED